MTLKFLGSVIWLVSGSDTVTDDLRFVHVFWSLVLKSSSDTSDVSEATSCRYGDVNNPTLSCCCSGWSPADVLETRWTKLLTSEMNEADDTDAIIHMYHHHGDGDDHADGLFLWNIYIVFHCTLCLLRLQTCNSAVRCDVVISYRRLSQIAYR